MGRPVSCSHQLLTLSRRYSEYRGPRPIISISKSTFYRQYPHSPSLAAQSNPALFQDLQFVLESHEGNQKHWAIIGPSSSGKTTFLQVLQGQHICIPPKSRQYPFLTHNSLGEANYSQLPSQAIKYVGFDGEQGIGPKAPRSAYLSARYESRRESTDFLVKDYLQGNTKLNAAPNKEGNIINSAVFHRVVKDLGLTELLNMPVTNLSNGQTRRARIARALLCKPEVLLLDEPFMGLDPITLSALSLLLHRLATQQNPRLVLTLRPQDSIPNWITHLLLLRGHCEIWLEGRKESVLKKRDEEIWRHELVSVQRGWAEVIASTGAEENLTSPELSGDSFEMSGNRQEPTNPAMEHKTNLFSRDGFPLDDTAPTPVGEPLVEVQGAHVRYGTQSVLGNWEQDVNGTLKPGLWWTVRRGERWGIFGPNGSGKTTILSLVCSDHPQTYCLPIQIFGRSRMSEPGQLGISIFEIQARIGHSSPEIHNHVPRSLTLYQVLANAWSDTFYGTPNLDAIARERINICLNWFEQDLKPNASLQTAEQPPRNLEPVHWAKAIMFSQLPFSSQKVALFIRAIIKSPDIVILDEALSGMDEQVRDRCLLFLAHGDTRFYRHTPDVRNGTREQQKEIHLSLGPSKMPGLNKEQALLCISHVRDEVPGSVREWICLPEANTGQPARFGRLKGPLEGDIGRWRDIWGPS